MSQQLKFVLPALGVAWAVDILFWQAGLGVNFALWVGLALAVSFILARVEKSQPARLTWLLAALTLGLASFTFIRSQPFTIFISLLLTVACLMLTAATFRHANWPFYRLVDTLKTVLQLMLAVLIRPVELFSKNTPAPSAEPTPKPRSALRGALPILRGLLFALPVVLTFTALLASADPIFGDQVKRWLAWFDLDHLGEYIFRLVYILIFAYILVGAYLHAVHPGKPEPRPDPNRDWIARMLGWTETFIILLAVNLLFILFVGIQFWYLFGGQANISATQYTYAEYARRGFNELVGVAVLSLGLYLVLSTITRFEKPSHQRWFTAFSGLLMAQVLVMLASAFQRLLLYEDAYGWTVLRTITHVFIIWLAALLIAVIALEGLRRRHHFGLAALIFAVGFGLTLGLLNVDGFIAQRNIARALSGAELDAKYLATLSDDAVPTFVETFQRPNLPQTVRDALGAELACRADALSDLPQTDWRAYNASRANARLLLAQAQPALSAYPVTRSGRSAQVTINGQRRACGNYADFLD